MDADLLLTQWPSWSKVSAEAILASPAWRMPVSFSRTDAALKLAEEANADTINLAITLDGEENVLCLTDSELYPDLHLLWRKRNALPNEIVLALVEKECGPVLQMLENTVRRQLSVKGLAEEDQRNKFPNMRSFALVADGQPLLGFTFGLTAALAVEFGQLKYLDTSHESIRTLSRDAVADYASVVLADNEISELAVGDFLLLTDEYLSSAKWQLEQPSDGLVHICGAVQVQISFGEIADERLPPVLPPVKVKLTKCGNTIAEGEITKTGLCNAVRITRIGC